MSWGLRGLGSIDRWLAAAFRSSRLETQARFSYSNENRLAEQAQD